MSLTEGGDGGFDGSGKGPFSNPKELKSNNTREVFKAALKNAMSGNPEQSEQAKAELESVFKEGLGGLFGNFQEIVNAANGKEKTPEVVEAKKSKEMLVEVADELIREKRESGEMSNDELFLGSSHMEKKFPTILAGIGREVSKKYVESEEIDGLLNRLEITRGRGGVDPDNPSFVEVLIQRIDVAIPTIMTAVKSMTDEVYMEQDAVMMALGNERQNLKEKLPYDPNSRVGSVSVPSSPEKPPRKTSGGNREKPPSKEPTIKTELEVSIDNSTQIIENINNGLEITSDQLNEFFSGINKFAKDDKVIKEATLNQIFILGENVDKIAKTVGEKLMTNEQKETVVKNITVIKSKIIDKGGTNKEELHKVLAALSRSVDYLSAIAESTRKTAEEAALANEKLANLVRINESINFNTDKIKTSVEKDKTQSLMVAIKEMFDKRRGEGEPELDISNIEGVISNLSKEVNDETLDADKNPEERFLRREKRQELFEALKWLKIYNEMLKGCKGKENKDAMEARLKKEKEIDTRNNNQENLKNREYGWDGTVEHLYKMLRSIETSFRSVEDLSTNSDKFGILFHMANGDYNEDFDRIFFKEGKMFGDKTVSKEDFAYLKTEIRERLLLHSLFLASSKCSSIEDIMRVVNTMHEGDIDGVQDKELLEFFFKKTFGRSEKLGVGLKEVPVELAWDLRQKGYFRIRLLMKEMIDSKDKGFMDFLAQETDGEKSVLYNKILNLADDNVEKLSGAIDKLLDIEVAIPANPQFGLSVDMPKNFYMIEKGQNEKGLLIKEYMIWRMIRIRKCSRENAEVAFELAHKMSVATFMDSCANLDFAQDDYSEILNFKLLRIADGPNGKTGRMPKNKGIGSLDTIGDLVSLTCHWMHLLRKDDLPVGTVNDPTYVNDIDLTKFKPTTAMPYHFFGVVGSQVEFIKDAFFNKFTAKDVNAPNFLNKVFSKINKTAYDMSRAGIVSFYEDDAYYAGINSKAITDEQKEKKGNLEAMIAEDCRDVWVRNTLAMARDPRNGWTRGDAEVFIRALYFSEQIVKYDKKKGRIRGTSFVAKKKLGRDISMSGIRLRLKDR